MGKFEEEIKDQGKELKSIQEDISIKESGAKKISKS